MRTEPFREIQFEGVLPQGHDRKHLDTIKETLNGHTQMLNEVIEERKNVKPVAEQEPFLQHDADHEIEANSPPILADTTAGDVEGEIDPASSQGLVYVKNQTGANNYIVTPKSGLIDGAADLTLAAGEGAILLADGENIAILARI